MKTWRIATIALCVVIVALPLIFQRSAQFFFARMNGAETFVWPQVVDLGALEHGLRTGAEVHIKNLTSHPIRIPGEISTCSCAASDQLPLTLEPREVKDIAIRVQLPKYKSDFDQTVSFLISETNGTIPRPVRILATVLNPEIKPDDSVKSTAPSSDANGGATNDENDDSSDVDRDDPIPSESSESNVPETNDANEKSV